MIKSSVYDMSQRDAFALLHAARDHLIGHEFALAERLFRRAWYSRLDRNDDDEEEEDAHENRDDDQEAGRDEETVDVSSRAIREQALVGIARVAEYEGKTTGYHRNRKDNKSASQVAHALRASTFYAHACALGSESFNSLRAESRLRALLIRELNKDPLFCEEVLHNTLFELRESDDTEEEEYGAEEKVTFRHVEANKKNAGMSGDPKKAISSARLDRMRDSLHGFVRQVSSETRLASRRRIVPESMIRDSLSSRLLNLPYRNDFPEDLKCLSEDYSESATKLKRHRSDAGCYSERRALKRASLRRQQSFDYSPNNLVDPPIQTTSSIGHAHSLVNLRRSQTLPSHSKRPQVERRPRSASRQDSFDSQYSTSSSSSVSSPTVANSIIDATESSSTTATADTLSQRILECWTHLRSRSMPNGIVPCNSGAGILCRRTHSDFLADSGAHAIVTLLTVLVDIDASNGRVAGSVCPVTEALLGALRSLADYAICGCTARVILASLESLACLAPDYGIGEAMLIERDAVLSDDARHGGSWARFARCHTRNARLNTLATLHRRIAGHVDQSRPPIESNPDAARIAGYLRRALQQNETVTKGDNVGCGRVFDSMACDISAHLGDMLLCDGDVVAASAYLERASAACDDIRTRAEALTRLASCLFLQSGYTRSQRLFETAHSLLQNCTGSHGELIAFARAMVSQCLHESRDNRNTLMWSIRALDAYHTHLGHVYSEMTEYHRSIGLYEKSLQSLDNCYSSIVDGSDDMHMMLLLRTIGDVLYSREDVENGVSQKEKVVAIYGHALRFANSDSAKFQIYDRLAVLKVTSSDFAGAGEDLNSALQSQINVQKGIGATLAYTLDELSGGFSLAGDNVAAVECATESLRASQEATPTGLLQRARTLRRLARLKRSDSLRTADYLKQAADIDPVSGVHYASYLLNEGDYFAAAMAVLPYVVARSETTQRQAFETDYLPGHLVSRERTDGQQEVEADVRCYALYLAVECYARLGMRDDLHRCFAELRVAVDAAVVANPSSRFELRMAAYAAVYTGEYSAAAHYFHWSEAGSGNCQYWMCVCLAAAQSVARVGKYFASACIVPEERLSIVSIIDTSETKEGNKIEDTQINEICSNRELEISIDPSSHESSSLDGSTLVVSDLSSEDDDEDDEQESDILSERSTDYNSGDCLDTTQALEEKDTRNLPTELELETGDQWEHVEETISTPEVLLDALRKLHEKEVEAKQSIECAQKLSINSELSNFEENTDNSSSESEKNTDNSSSESEEEIFQTWEEYTEYSAIPSLNQIVESEIQESLEEKIKESDNQTNKESGTQEDKGYNSDSEWVTSEEIVDTPFVIMQAMKNTKSISC